MRVFPVILLFFTLIIALLLVDSNFRIVTTEYELYYSNLPDSFDGFRIVLLADVHDTEFGRDNKRLISRVHDANPDIIAISGDLLNAYGNSRAFTEQLKLAESLIIRLTPVAPVYFVTGNHEMNFSDSELEDLFLMLDIHGVHLLRNEYTLLNSNGESIFLVGIDGKTGSVAERDANLFIEEIFTTTGDNFVLMLKHSNHYLSLYSEVGVDLILSGHSHGGIVRLPFTDGLLGQQRDWFPKYTNGVYTLDDTTMLVSRGLGNATGMLRFLNNPHIAVAVLRSA